MRTTSHTDGKRPRRNRRHVLGWHGWLLYLLIAVSAYLLVALAEAVPDAVDAAGVADMTAYMAGRMVAKTSTNDLSVEQVALEEKMRAHASSPEADHADFDVFPTRGAMSRCLFISGEGRESRPRCPGTDRDEVQNRR